MRKKFEYGEHSHVSDAECVPCYCENSSCGEQRKICGKLMCAMVNERRYELIQWGYYYPCVYQTPEQIMLEEE